MQGPGSEGTRHSASPFAPGSERFDTPHLRHEPGGAFSFHPSAEQDARRPRDGRRQVRRRGAGRCLTTDGLGRNTQYLQQVERRRPACHGAMDRGSRDSRCPAYPLSRRAAGAPHTRLSPPSGARAVPHSPRVGGASSRCAPHAAVAQRTRAPGFEPGGREFESLRRRSVCSKSCQRG